MKSESNFDKSPAIHLNGRDNECFQGWKNICLEKEDVLIFKLEDRKAINFLIEDLEDMERKAKKKNRVWVCPSKYLPILKEKASAFSK